MVVAEAVVVRGLAMAVSGEGRRDSGWEVNQLLVSQSVKSDSSTPPPSLDDQLAPAKAATRLPPSHARPLLN